MKRYAVIGLGNFGMDLALELARAGQKVLAVDVSADRARDAQAWVDQALVGDATDRDNLTAMGVGEVDVVAVSLGNRTEATTLVTLHLSRLGVPEILVKAVSEDHGEILSRVGATRVVFPEKEMATRVAERLGSRSVLDYLSFSAGFSVLELAPGKDLVGRTLAQLDLGRRYGVQVVAIREFVPEGVEIAPGPDRVVKDSDILVVLGPEEAVRTLQEEA